MFDALVKTKQSTNNFSNFIIYLQDITCFLNCTKRNNTKNFVIELKSEKKQKEICGVNKNLTQNALTQIL